MPERLKRTASGLVRQFTWNWARLSEPAAISNAVTFAYLPFGLAGPLFIDPERLGGSTWQWLAIGLSGQLALMLVFWFGRFATRALVGVSERAISHVVVIVVAVSGRAIVIAFLAQGSGIANDLEFEYRLQSGLVAQTGALIILSLVVSAYKYHKSIATNLALQRNELDQLRGSISSRLEQIRSAIRAEVHASIDPLISQLDASLERIASSSDAIRVRESIQEIVDDELRPLSHRLIASSQNPLRNRHVHVSDPEVALPISSHVSVRMLLRPIVVGVLVALLSASQSIRQFDFPYSAIFPILTGMVMAIAIAIQRRIFGTLFVRTWLAVIIATLLTVISLGIAFLFYVVLGLPIPDPIGVEAVISIGGIGFASAIYMVITERRSLTEEQLRLLIQDEQNYLSLLRQSEYIARTQLSYVIHGSLQSSLHAASIRLSSQPEPTLELITQIRSDIAQSVNKIDTSESPYIMLIDTLSSIAEVWNGTSLVRWSIDYRTVRQLVESTSAAVSVAEICREGVANAVRHGKATEIQIRINASDGHVRVEVIDNGSGSLAGSQHGLGSHMLNELCVSWARTQESHGVKLLAEVAL
jgi:hypothetical protein